MPFASIAGQQRLLALLARAIARDTLPPSLLFAGSAGIGKRRTAVAVAETLNCLAPLLDSRSERPEPSRRARTSGVFEIDACGECASCRRIARGVHADVVVLEPGDTGSIKTDQVREIIDRANYRPFEGRRRVVIVDEADALIDAAQNALLKTLEEPPPTSVFILVSSMPDVLLPTVRSRCRPLRFGDLTSPEIAGVLVRDHKYSQVDAIAAAADAGGSVGRALAASAVDLVEAREAAQRLLQQAARVADPARRLELVRGLTGKATGAAERDLMAGYLRAMASLLRDLGILSNRADPATLANADLREDLGRLTAAFDSERSTRAFNAVDQALAALDRNVNPKVVADWLVLQL
jgi:DNA polymerase-3 subunit delta'